MEDSAREAAWRALIRAQSSVILVAPGGPEELQGMLSVGNDGVLQAMLRALLVLPDAGHRPPHYGCGVQLSALLVQGERVTDLVLACQLHECEPTMALGHAAGMATFPASTWKHQGAARQPLRDLPDAVLAVHACQAVLAAVREQAQQSTAPTRTVVQLHLVPSQAEAPGLTQDAQQQLPAQEAAGAGSPLPPSDDTQQSSSQPSGTPAEDCCCVQLVGLGGGVDVGAAAAALQRALKQPQHEEEEEQAALGASQACAAPHGLGGPLWAVLQRQLASSSLVLALQPHQQQGAAHHHAHQRGATPQQWRAWEVATTHAMAVRRYEHVVQRLEAQARTIAELEDGELTLQAEVVRLTSLLRAHGVPAEAPPSPATPFLTHTPAAPPPRGWRPPSLIQTTSLISPGANATPATASLDACAGRSSSPATPTAGSHHNLDPRRQTGALPTRATTAAATASAPQLAESSSLPLDEPATPCLHAMAQGALRTAGSAELPAPPNPLPPPPPHLEPHATWTAGAQAAHAAGGGHEVGGGTTSPGGPPRARGGAVGALAAVPSDASLSAWGAEGPHRRSWAEHAHGAPADDAPSVGATPQGSSALRPPQRPASPPASLQQELGACHAELAALRLHLDMMAQRLAARAGRAVPVRLEVLQEEVEVLRAECCAGAVQLQASQAECAALYGQLHRATWRLQGVVAPPSPGLRPTSSLPLDGLCDLQPGEPPTPAPGASPGGLPRDAHALFPLTPSPFLGGRPQAGRAPRGSPAVEEEEEQPEQEGGRRASLAAAPATPLLFTAARQRERGAAGSAAAPPLLAAPRAQLGVKPKSRAPARPAAAAPQAGGAVHVASPSAAAAEPGSLTAARRGPAAAGAGAGSRGASASSSSHAPPRVKAASFISVSRTSAAAARGPHPAARQLCPQEHPSLVGTASGGLEEAAHVAPGGTPRARLSRSSPGASPPSGEGHAAAAPAPERAASTAQDALGIDEAVELALPPSGLPQHHA